jgi:VWFA-related protein
VTSHYRSRSFRRTAALVFVCAVFGTARAEPGKTGRPESVLEEEVRVRVRFVDFLVVDKQGRPVTDLGRDEVELWDGGEPQTILDFYPPHRRVTRPEVQTGERGETNGDHRGPAARSIDEATVKPGERERRWIILFFDVRNLSYQGRVRSARAARELIEEHLTPQDRVALIVDEDELKILVPFTKDHGRVVEYIRDPEGLSTRYRDIERRLKDLRDDTESCRDAEDLVRCARMAATSFVFETARETETSLDHLEALLRGLAAIPDRKILFYFSEGFVENPGDVAAAAVEHAIGQFGYSVTQMQMFLSRDYRHRLDPIYQLATRARTGLYTVNTVRKMTDDLFSPERATDYGPENLPQARSDPFEATWQQVRKVHTQMAHATGAMPLFRRDPEGLLGEQLDAAAGVYTLSYQPTAFSWDRRKIKIKVSRAKTRILYRNRYNYVADRTRRLEGELTVESTTVAPSGGYVQAELEVAGRGFELVPESTSPASVVSVFFELRDARDRPVQELYEVITFPRGREESGDEKLRRPFALMLPPGEYSLRVDVSDVNGPGKGAFFRRFTVGSRSEAAGEQGGEASARGEPRP